MLAGRFLSLTHSVHSPFEAEVGNALAYCRHKGEARVYFGGSVIGIQFFKVGVSLEFLVLHMSNDMGDRVTSRKIAYQLNIRVDLSLGQWGLLGVPDVFNANR